MNDIVLRENALHSALFHIYLMLKTNKQNRTTKYTKDIKHHLQPPKRYSNA